jgi:hypothetical protein
MRTIRISGDNFHHETTLKIIEGLKSRGFRFIGQVDGDVYDLHFEADIDSILVIAGTVIAVTSYYYDSFNGHTFFAISNEEYEHYAGMTALEVIEAA